MRILAALFFVLPIAMQKATAGTQLNFNHDIAPIIYRHCAACHRHGEAAPFPLLSYQDVSKKGQTIAKVLATRAMPPWKPEPGSFSYRDDRRLSDEQIALVQAWVKGGMAEGNGAEKVEPPKFESGYLPQYRSAARPHGRKVDHRYRDASLRARGRSSCSVLR
jgi:mono/diheme cytochrome c family protein